MATPPQENCGYGSCNWNSGTVLEKHLNFIVPEPAKGEAWDIGVELKGDITKQDK